MTKTAAATGVGKSTVKDIISPPDFSTPGKRKRRVDTKFCKVDDFDRCALRRMVHRFFLDKKQPTLKSLHEAAVKDLEFKYSREYLRQILISIGFVYRRRKANVALFERSDIVARRREYLREIRSVRRDNKPIVYLDETWVNQGYTRDHAWQDKDALANPEKARRDGLSVGMINKPSGAG